MNFGQKCSKAQVGGRLWCEGTQENDKSLIYEKSEYRITNKSYYGIRYIGIRRSSWLTWLLRLPVQREKLWSFRFVPWRRDGTRVALFREVLHRSSNYFSLSALICCFTGLYCTLYYASQRTSFKPKFLALFLNSAFWQRFFIISMYKRKYEDNNFTWRNANFKVVIKFWL